MDSIQVAHHGVGPARHVFQMGRCSTWAPSGVRCDRISGVRASSDGHRGRRSRLGTMTSLSCLFNGLPVVRDATVTSCLLPRHVTMLKTPSLLLAVAGLVLATFGAAAAPTNKCVVNGMVTYQQAPCPSDQVRKPLTVEQLNVEEKKRRAVAPATSGGFSCDGRRYCSQMNSCAEARYFNANCPGVKMDGDRNGVPCEKQWCSR